MEMIDDMILQKRANLYSKKQIAVHITKKNNEWLNGLIFEVSSDFLMLDEFKKGKVPIFFIEIINIETYTSLNKDILQ